MNAVAIFVGFLFWGWLWDVMGMLDARNARYSNLFEYRAPVPST
jgi:hypothetical protein